MKPIIFYDIPCSVKGLTWSPNLQKGRYTLNFKKLPYQVEWVEYPDIEQVCKKIGAAPTGSDRTPYTLPAIFDPNTNTAFTDSALIAEYLDKTYPDTPKAFPPGTHALQHASLDAFASKLAALWQFSLPASSVMLNPVSREYFERTRKQWFGTPLSELTPKGEKGVEEWGKVKAGFDDVDTWYKHGEANGPFLLGEQPGFVDFAVASFILWAKTIWGPQSTQWKDFMSWHGGRWQRLIKSLEQYETAA